MIASWLKTIKKGPCLIKTNQLQEKKFLNSFKDFTFEYSVQRLQLISIENSIVDRSQVTDVMRRPR